LPVKCICLVVPPPHNACLHLSLPAVKAAGVSVVSGKTYEDEFALEMAKARAGKAKSTPWGSGYAAAPEILHGGRPVQPGHGGRTMVVWFMCGGGWLRQLQVVGWARGSRDAAASFLLVAAPMSKLVGWSWHVWLASFPLPCMTVGVLAASCLSVW
jgi:hypothetical protein